MKAFSRLVAVLIACCVVAEMAAAAPRFRGLDWKTYEIESFGVRLRYPSRLFEIEKVSEQGDGRVFASRDGRARLLVGVLDNPERLTPATYQRKIARQSYSGAAIDYSPVGASWFVLSGTIDDKIFYEKVMFGCGGSKVSSFAMVYPVAKRKLYDTIVEHIEDSYRSSFDRRGCP